MSRSHIRQAQVRLPVKAQPPRHRKKSKEGIWRVRRRHNLSGITVPPEEARGWDPGHVSHCLSAHLCCHHCQLHCDSGVNTASHFVLLSLLRSDKGKSLVIRCLLREEIIDKDDSIQLHSADQISPRVSLHGGGGWGAKYRNQLDFTLAWPPEEWPAGLPSLTCSLPLTVKESRK